MYTESYKLLESVDDNLFCYTRIVENKDYVDDERKSPLRLYDSLVSFGRIRSEHDIVMIIEFHVHKTLILIKIVHNTKCTRRIQIPQDDTDAFNRVIDKFLLLNIYVETINYRNPNTSGDEEGSTMIIDPGMGDLKCEKILRSIMTLKDIIMIDIERVDFQKAIHISDDHI